MIKIITKLKVKYIDNITIDIRNYSKIEDNDIWKLISKVEIRKLVSLRYFDNQ